jgi:hypothetical protein
VAFVPYTSQDKPRISFNKDGDMVLNTKFERQKVIVFDEFELDAAARDYVQSLVDENPAFDSFRIHAGDHFIQQAQSRETCAEYVDELTDRYNDMDKGNFYGNWLGGMTAVRFKKQKSTKALEKAMKKASAKKKAKAKAKKRRKSTK